MNKKLLLFSFILFGSISNSLCATNVDYAIPYLQNGSAPSYFTANQSHSNSMLGLYENEASIRIPNKLSITSFSTSIYNELMYQTYAVGIKRKSYSIIFGIAKFGDNSIAKTAINQNSIDQEFVRVGSYGYDNRHYKLTLQKIKSQRLSFALSGNFYKTNIDTINGSGFNVSAAAFIKSDNLDLGIGFQNIIESKITFNNSKKETLPLITILSAEIRKMKLSYTPRLIFLNSDLERKRNFLFSSGIHYTLINKVTLSASRYEQFSGLDINHGYAYGVKFDLSEFLLFNVVYRHIEYEDQANNYLFSVGLNI